MPGISKKSKASEYIKEPGVEDIQPFQARAYFARALSLENDVGKTTPEAETALEKAVDLAIN